MDGFFKMSKYAGMREDLVQAGGGNSACKMSQDRMLIKASGCQLADLDVGTGYAVVNPEVIRSAFLHCRDMNNMTEADAKGILQEALIEGERPSIETFLHSVSGKYSLHTHPIVVNVLACRTDGMKILKEMFPEALMIPYATPGIELAKEYFAQYQKYGSKIHIVFLQNHGLLVSGETADEVIAVTERVVKDIESFLQIDMTGYHAVTELYQMFAEGVVWRVTDQNVMDAWTCSGHSWDFGFCPDCIVFLGKLYDAGWKLDKIQFDCFREEYGEPVIIAYKNKLYIHAASVKKALEIQSVLSFAAQVIKQNIGFECDFLSEQEQHLLLDWEAEKYRKTMK